MFCKGVDDIRVVWIKRLLVGKRVSVLQSKDSEREAAYLYSLVVLCVTVSPAQKREASEDRAFVLAVVVVTDCSDEFQQRLLAA